MDTTSHDNSNGENEFVVTFRNGALEKLKELATTLNIPENELGSVLQKGLKIIDLAKDGKIVLEKDKERFDIDLKRL